jgi:hypothetical protein
MKRRPAERSAAFPCLVLRFRTSHRKVPRRFATFGIGTLKRFPLRRMQNSAAPSVRLALDPISTGYALVVQNHVQQ